ncbi:unnamed protein product [Amoebophrya sp. A25]|nr:unnamed protein product [Amoebophrya sp. A25]|eukprot:GSA25T00005492001.1
MTAVHRSLFDQGFEALFTLTASKEVSLGSRRHFSQPTSFGTTTAPPAQLPAQAGGPGVGSPITNGQVPGHQQEEQQDVPEQQHRDQDPVEIQQKLASLTPSALKQLSDVVDNLLKTSSRNGKTEQEDSPEEVVVVHGDNVPLAEIARIPDNTDYETGVIRSHQVLLYDLFQMLEKQSRRILTAYKEASEGHEKDFLPQNNAEVDLSATSSATNDAGAGGQATNDADQHGTEDAPKIPPFAERISPLLHAMRESVDDALEQSERNLDHKLVKRHLRHAYPTFHFDASGISRLGKRLQRWIDDMERNNANAKASLMPGGGGNEEHHHGHPQVPSSSGTDTDSQGVEQQVNKECLHHWTRSVRRLTALREQAMAADNDLLSQLKIARLQSATRKKISIEDQQSVVDLVKDITTRALRHQQTFEARRLRTTDRFDNLYRLVKKRLTDSDADRATLGRQIRQEISDLENAAQRVEVSEHMVVRDLKRIRDAAGLAAKFL